DTVGLVDMHGRELVLVGVVDTLEGLQTGVAVERSVAANDVVGAEIRHGEDVEPARGTERPDAADKPRFAADPAQGHDQLAEWTGARVDDGGLDPVAECRAG